MLKRLLLIALGFTLSTGLACKSSQEESAPAPKPPEVSVSRVVQRSVIDYEMFTGRFESVQSVEVRARVNGFLNSINFTDGDEINQGDFLFQIDPRPFEAALKNAEGQKAQWEAKRDRAKADVARYESLVPTGAASKQDLDKARADLGEAIAAIQSADAAIDVARLDLEFSKITAPVDGQISLAFISIGNLVRANLDVLTTIVSLDPIYVYFSVNERSLLKFRERAREAAITAGTPLPDVRTLKIPVYLGLDTEEGYPHRGEIDFADNKLDPTTGTIRVRGKFDNSKRIFKNGFFARVRLPMTEPHDAILVIDRAVGTDQTQKFVYVVDDKGVAQYRAVKLGRLEDDGLREIADGLRPGETVVVNGLQRVRPGKPVTPQLIEMPRQGVDVTSTPTTTAPQQTTSSEQPSSHPVEQSTKSH